MQRTITIGEGESQTFDLVVVDDRTAGISTCKLGFRWGSLDDARRQLFDGLHDKKAAISEDQAARNRLKNRVSFGDDGSAHLVDSSSVLSLTEAKSCMTFSAVGILCKVNWLVYLARMVIFYFIYIFVSKDIVNDLELNEIIPDDFAKMIPPNASILNKLSLCLFSVPPPIYLSLFMYIGILIYEYYRSLSINRSIGYLQVLKGLLILSTHFAYNDIHKLFQSSSNKTSQVRQSMVAFGSFVFLFGFNNKVLKSKAYRFLTANFFQKTGLETFLASFAFTDPALICVELGYGWAKLLLVYICSGLVANIGVYSFGNSSHINIGSSFSIIAVLVLGKLYMGRLVGGCEGAVWTSNALFMLMSEVMVCLLGVKCNGIIVVALFMIFMSRVTSSRTSGWIDVFKAHSGTIGLYLYYLINLHSTADDAIKLYRIGRACGASVGLLFFLLLSPSASSPSVPSREAITSTRSYAESRPDDNMSIVDSVKPLNSRRLSLRSRDIAINIFSATPMASSNSRNANTSSKSRANHYLTSGVDTPRVTMRASSAKKRRSLSVKGMDGASLANIDYSNSVNNSSNNIKANDGISTNSATDESTIINIYREALRAFAYMLLAVHIAEKFRPLINRQSLDQIK